MSYSSLDKDFAFGKKIETCNFQILYNQVIIFCIYWLCSTVLPNKQRGVMNRRIIQKTVEVFGISIIQNFHKQNKSEAI